MAASGVSLDENVLTLFNDMKMKKQQLRYVILHIENKKTITLKSKGDKSETYQDFVSKLTPEEPAYCLVDVPYTTKTGIEDEKLIFVQWVPDTAPVRPKMLYSSSADAVKKVLTGIQIQMQASDVGDLDLADIQKNLTR